MLIIGRFDDFFFPFFFFCGSHLHQERFHGTQQNLLLWNQSNQTTAITLSIDHAFRTDPDRRSMISNENRKPSKFKPTLRPTPETRLRFPGKDETVGLKTNSDFSNFLEGRSSSRHRFRDFLYSIRSM